MRALGLIFVLTACAHERAFEAGQDPHDAFGAWLFASGNKSPVVFAYRRGGSGMRCTQSYSVLIRQDGTVEFEGGLHVRRPGFSTWQLPVERLASIEKKAAPVWETDLNDVHSGRDLVDLEPSCIYLGGHGRQRLTCFAPTRGDSGRVIETFTRYLTFKTNAVQWIGEYYEACRTSGTEED